MNNNELEKFNRKRKRMVIEYILVTIIFFGYNIYKITTGTFLFNATGSINIIIPVILLFGFAIWFAIFLERTRKLLHILSKEVMKKLTSETMSNFKYNPEIGVSELLFRKSNFIKRFDHYTSSNLISGAFENGKRFLASDIIVTEENKDSEGHTTTSTLFKGIFAVLETNKKLGFNVQILPDVKNKYLNQILSSVKKMAGAKNIVRLENTEFERYFEVYSDNQVECRKIITINFMEKLLLLVKRLKQKVTIFYVDGVIYLFVNKINVVNNKELLLKGITNELIENTNVTINNLYETMNLLIESSN